MDLMNQFVPASNRPDGTFQTVSGIHQDRTDQFTVKFDHRINDKQDFLRLLLLRRQHAV